jgi:hypothetical protein
MRPPMRYSDHSTAGRSSGPYQIIVTRLIPRQDGQESSANGTGPEKTCAGRGCASGTARRCNASERRYCRGQGRAASLPDPDCPIARAPSGQDRYCRPAGDPARGVV